MADGQHPYKARPVAGSHVWLTPPNIIEALGAFDLDPCAAPSPRPWPTADCHIELPDDGLAVDWSGRVWCNPPFGSQTWAWLSRMADHGKGTALCFARTDTRGFHDFVWKRAAAIMFLEGRPSFYLPDGTKASGNSGGPICLIAYGQGDADKLQRSGLAGAFVRLRAASQGQEGGSHE